MGTGPFRFVSWEKDVKIAFRKFDGYWQKGKPYLDGIENMIIYDKVVGGLSFKKGETDSYVEPLYEDIAGYEKEGYRINRLLGAFASPTAGAIPDSADPNSPFAKLKVRQAVAHAIDTQAMVKAILAGEGVGCTQWMYPGIGLITRASLAIPTTREGKTASGRSGLSQWVQDQVHYYGRTERSISNMAKLLLATWIR